MAQMVKHLSTMRETRVQSLGWEDPLEKEMAIHSSTIAWKETDGAISDKPCQERTCSLLQCFWGTPLSRYHLGVPITTNTTCLKSKNTFGEKWRIGVMKYTMILC